MLKLRNAVLTALLAFCLAMPFVSCSFNDGATGDVSDKVTVQSDNNQNGGNENPSGGNNGGSGNENPSGGNEKPTDPTEPGAGTTYVVIYNGDIIEESLPESMWFYGVEEVNLEEGVDYTMKGNEITLTYSGYQKVLPLLESSGGDGGQEVIPPVTDGPVTDGPVTDGPVPDVPGDGKGTYTVMYNGQPLVDENGEVVTIPAAALDYYKSILSEGDYTISGNVITLTESGFNKLNKLSAAGSGAGE